MPFNRFEFEETLDDIEKLLGYLRGNENAWKYLREANQWMHDNYTEGVLFVFRLDDHYAFPCPDGRYKVEPSRMIPFNIYLKYDQRFDRDPYVKALQESIDMAWQDGVAWASGVAEYARSVCDQFTQPSVPVLVDAIVGMQKEVVGPLLDAPNDDWANLGNFPSLWKGTAADEFNNFYANYNDVLSRDALFTNMMNIGFASAAKVISGTQFGAQKFVESIKSILEAQLDQWARYDREPPDPSPPPPWVADVLKIGADVLNVAVDLVPVVKQAKDKVEDIKTKTGNATKLIEDIEEVAGIDLHGEEHKDIPVKTAEEIYKAFTETLYVGYYKAFNQALDDIQKGQPVPSTAPDPGDITSLAFSGAGVIAQMNNDKDGHQWELPQVPDQDLGGGVDYYPSS